MSLVVLVELNWVLRRAYRMSASEVAGVVERLLRARELVVQDADLVRRGLRASGVELPDAVIAELGRSGGCSTTATFDRRASTHDGMTLL